MYLIGAEHPNKQACIGVVDRLIDQGERLVTDAEVFQEILHRYTAIGRPEFIDPAFDLLRKIVDEVFPIDVVAVELARSIIRKTRGISARDAIHVATMETHNVVRVVSFDTGFDRIRGLVRIEE